MLVNVPFGAMLTTTARYPLVKTPDPFVKKVPAWKKVLRTIIVLLVAAFAVLYFTDNLKFMGIQKKAKAQTEQVCAEPCPEEVQPADTPSDMQSDAQ